MSQMENVPISVENQVQNNNVYHTGQEKKDQGFTAFRQKTINTPTGKIHKIAIVRKPLDALSKLAANPLPEFEEIRAPPKMYKKEDRIEACVLHDFLVYASGERIVKIELETGSEASSTSVPLPLIQDKLGNIQVIHDHSPAQKYGPGASENIINNTVLENSSTTFIRSSQSQAFHYDPEILQQMVGGIPVEELKEGPIAQTPEAISIDRLHNGFLTGDSADRGVASAPPAQEPDYDKLSDEVMTTSESAPKGVPADHADLVAKTRRAVKIWCCKLCGRLYGRWASLLMHLNVHQGFRPFSCPDCKISFYYK